MMEQVRLCAVWPMENWLASSLNQIQGWTTLQESCSRALKQGSLPNSPHFTPPISAPVKQCYGGIISDRVEVAQKCEEEVQLFYAPTSPWGELSYVTSTKGGKKLATCTLYRVEGVDVAQEMERN